MLWFSFLFLSLFWCQRQLLDWDFRIGNCNRRAKKGKEIRKKEGKTMKKEKKEKKEKQTKKESKKKFIY